MRRPGFWILFWIIGSMLYGGRALSQTTLTGTIISQDKAAPLEGVNVIIKGQGMDTMIATDTSGNYSITYSGQADSVIFVLMGYHRISEKINSDTVQTIDAVLVPEQSSLSEVVITSKNKTRYRNKNNPAVELIRQVIDHKDENSVQHYNTLTYEQYEKLQIGTSNTPKYIYKLPLLRKFRFMFENIDTASIPGKTISPIFLEENITTQYIDNIKNKKKSILTGRKQIAFDRRYVDKDVFNVYLNHLYKDVNIYDNDISVITNTFLSPIAGTAPTFYKFFIQDTFEFNGAQFIRLEFYPRNKKDFLFSGILDITLDGHYGVQHATMKVGKEVNLNFVNDLNIDLSFERGSDSHFYMSKSISSAFFSIMNGRRGMYAARTVAVSDFSINPVIVDSFMEGAASAITRIDTLNTSKPEYWEGKRAIPLTPTESKTYTNLDSLIHMRSFKLMMDVGNTIFTGYQNLHQVELGPIYSLYSYNNLEGVRTRFGGRTTDEFSKWFYGEAYGAYGFKDERFKYLLRGAYAFNHKSIYTYPQHFLRVGYQHDVMVPGQQFQYSANDNFLISFQRGDNNSFVYFNNLKAEYVYEFSNIMKLAGQFSHQDLQAAGVLNYVRNAETLPDTVNRIITSDIGLEWGWKPFQKFIQRKYYRTAMPNKYPAITINLNMGIKGLWDADFNYQSLRLSIDKRFYLSQLGYADVKLSGGYIWGELPYPLLQVPQANQSYIYQLSAYNLMNYMEFVTDRYAALHIDYHMMGFILNKIPLIKKLNLRETFNFKILYGGLSAENDPAINPNVFAFPKDPKGNQVVYPFTNEPYIEAAVGIDNILNLFRVDFIKRFSYLDHPNVNSWGIRAMFSMDF